MLTMTLSKMRLSPSSAVKRKEIGVVKPDALVDHICQNPHMEFPTISTQSLEEDSIISTLEVMLSS
jgi:hypothetical protein